MKALLDFIPLVIFFVLFKQQGIWEATKALLIATTVIHAIHFVLQKWRLERMQWITLIATLAFGCVTLLLHDDIYIRAKSTVINWIFAIVLLASPFVGKDKIPLIQRGFQSAFDLSRAGWMRLNYIWVLFFFLLGLLHGIFAFIWYEQWIEFKVFGGTAIMLVFIIGNFVALRKHFKHPEG
ncbi:septation protein IspZ [Alkanindiges sp. WGS2144]|uniref:septation protein IspZ n=1 Tax=Alkanindiges sp. WGS2144 TaxID=3366808 RepID=UPI0037539A5B